MIGGAVAVYETVAEKANAKSMDALPQNAGFDLVPPMLSRTDIPPRRILVPTWARQRLNAMRS